MGRWAVRMTLRTNKSSSRQRRAFTLVEILLVLAIMAITTVVSMPYLVKSIRGNRLRVATATIVKAGRYARNMALIHAQEMKVVIDIKAATVSIAPHYETAPPAPNEGVPLPAAGSAGSPPPGPPGEEAPAAASPSLHVFRQLDAVRIEYVQLENKPSETDGLVTIIYRSNGRCSPYSVRVVDEYDNAMVITVDALSSPEVEREDR